MNKSKQTLLILLALCLFIWIGKAIKPQLSLIIKGHISRAKFDSSKNNNAITPKGYAPEVVGYPIKGDI